ncbi:MAG: tetratricopeptide repeat protein [Planctomycetes bacterium]|nr:tetratricopeptide repeat protein [Planctomycetota bacterium]
MQRKLLGDEHAELALCLSNLATLLGVKGDYAGAESLLREALAMQRRLLGDEHPNVATSLNNLAMLLMNKGDYAAAEPPFREALEMRRKLLGDEHPDVALSLNNLAGLIQNQGNFAGAEPLYRQALATRRKLLGDKHTDVAQSLSTLAALLQSKGDYGDAEPLYCEALELFRKLLGDEHPYVASSLNNLAAFLYAKGDFAAAEPLFCEALAMRRKMLGDVHPDVALSLNNLAALHASKGDYAGAEPLLREALAIAERQRTSIVGGEAERAAFAERLQLSQITSALAYAVIRMRQPDAACEALERGHNRALLDLMARRDSDLGAETAASNPQAAQQLHLREQKEAARRIKLATAEAKIAETQSRHDLSPADKSTLIEEQLAAIRQSRRALSDATALVFESLRAVWPDAKPLTPEAIRSALSPGEVIFTYNWTRDSLSAIVVPPAAAGPVQAAVIAEGKDKIQSIRASALSAKSYISHRPAQSPESVADPLAELHTALVTSLPADIRATIDSARRVIFLPDGPLVGIPFDLVLASGRDATSAVAKPQNQHRFRRSSTPTRAPSM